MADSITSKYAVLKDIKNVDGVRTGVCLVKNVNTKKKLICKKVSKDSNELKILKQLTNLPGIIKIRDHTGDLDLVEQEQDLTEEDDKTTKDNVQEKQPSSSNAQQKQSSKGSAQKEQKSKGSALKERRTKGNARGGRRNNSEDDEPVSNLSFVNYCNLGSIWQALTPITDAFLACQSGQDRLDQIEGRNRNQGDETDDSDSEDSDSEDSETEDSNQAEGSNQKVSAPTKGSDQNEVDDEDEECSNLEYDESAYDLVFFEYCDLGDLDGIKRRHENAFTRIPEPFIWHVLATVVEAIKECHTTDGKTDAKAIAHRNVQLGHILFSSSHAADSPFPRVVLTGFRESFNTTSVSQLRSDYTKLGKALWQLCLVADQRPKANEDDEDFGNIDEDLLKLLSGEYESSDVFGYSVELQTIIGELVNEMMFPKIDGKYVLGRMNKLKAAAKMCEHGGEVILKDPKAKE